MNSQRQIYHKNILKILFCKHDDDDDDYSCFAVVIRTDTQNFSNEKTYFNSEQELMLHAH